MIQPRPPGGVLLMDGQDPGGGTARYAERRDQEPSRLARWLRGAMANHGLTQRQLATALGVNRSTVAHWLNYNERPGTESLLALADFFGVRRQDLFDLAGIDLPPELRESDPLAGAVRVPVVRDLVEFHPTQQWVAWLPDEAVEEGQVVAVRVPAPGLPPLLLPDDLALFDRRGSPGVDSVICLRAASGAPEFWRVARQGSQWRLATTAGDVRGSLPWERLVGVVIHVSRPRQAFRFS